MKQGWISKLFLDTIFKSVLSRRLRKWLLCSDFAIWTVLVWEQEIMKVREVIPHTGPIPIIIPLKLFLDLLRDPVFPRGLTDSQSHVPIFTNVDSWANSHEMIRVVHDLPSNKNGGGCWDKRVYTFSGRTWLVDYGVKRFQWLMFWNLYLGRNELCNRQDFAQNGKWQTIVDKKWMKG